MEAGVGSSDFVIGMSFEGCPLTGIPSVMRYGLGATATPSTCLQRPLDPIAVHNLGL